MSPVRRAAGPLGASLPVLVVAALTLAAVPVAALVAWRRPEYSSIALRVVSGIDSLAPVYLAFGAGALLHRLGWFAIGVAVLLAAVMLPGYAQWGSWRFFGMSPGPCIVWFSMFPLIIAWLFLPVRLLTGPIARCEGDASRFQFRMFDLLMITAVAAGALSLARLLDVDLASWRALRDVALCTGYTLLPVLVAAGSRRWHFLLGLAAFAPVFWLSVHRNLGGANWTLLVNNLAFLLAVFLPLLALRMVGYRFRSPRRKDEPSDEPSMGHGNGRRARAALAPAMSGHEAPRRRTHGSERRAPAGGGPSRDQLPESALWFRRFPRNDRNETIIDK